MEGAVNADETPTFSGPDIPVWTGRDFLPYSMEFGMDQENFADNAAEWFTNGYAEYVSSKTATGSG